MKVMTDLYELLHDRELKKKAATGEARTKIALERQAGAELRDAATKGLVRKDELCDVSQLKGSSTREKGGQRGR